MAWLWIDASWPAEGQCPVDSILAALSVACDGLKALLPLFIAWQWAERHRLAAAAGAALFALLLAYGTGSAIGFAAENRAACSAPATTAMPL